MTPPSSSAPCSLVFLSVRELGSDRAFNEEQLLSYDIDAGDTSYRTVIFLNSVMDY